MAGRILACSAAQGETKARQAAGRSTRHRRGPKKARGAGSRARREAGAAVQGACARRGMQARWRKDGLLRPMARGRTLPFGGAARPPRAGQDGGRCGDDAGQSAGRKNGGPCPICAVVRWATRKPRRARALDTTGGALPGQLSGGALPVRRRGVPGGRVRHRRGIGAARRGWRSIPAAAEPARRAVPAAWPLRPFRQNARAQRRRRLPAQRRGSSSGAGAPASSPRIGPRPVMTGSGGDASRRAGPQAGRSPRRSGRPANRPYACRARQMLLVRAPGVPCRAPRRSAVRVRARTH